MSDKNEKIDDVLQYFINSSTSRAQHIMNILDKDTPECLNYRIVRTQNGDEYIFDTRGNIVEHDRFMKELEEANKKIKRDWAL